MTNESNQGGTLPFVTADLPGLGGRIKSAPEDFVVEEIPAYEPCGKGDHLYVRLTREGWTTKALADRLMGIFGLRDVDVGWAGLKDKEARVTQTLSLLLPSWSEVDAERRIEAELPVRVESVCRHGNKLKTGHLLGNRFTVVLEDPAEGGLALAMNIVAGLLMRGVANYYGPQRFGARGDNAERGRELLEGRGPRDRWLRRFLLSAYQAGLFNQWLARRLTRGDFDRLLEGDIAKKTDTGGLFEVAELSVEEPRFARREITYTGPIYGAKMKWAGGPAGEREREILERDGMTLERLKKAGLDGSRRPARLYLDSLDVAAHERGLIFRFALPKGAYATSVLREFTKAEVSLPEE